VLGGVIPNELDPPRVGIEQHRWGGKFLLWYYWGWEVKQRHKG